MNYILAFVGPSGSGKTTLMAELIKTLPNKTGILKSTTTRPSRGPEDAINYDFISVAEAEKTVAENRAATHVFYAGNHYIYEKQEIEKTLSKVHGCCAVVEPTILQIIKSGYPMKVIRVVPKDQNFTREGRQAADEARSKIEIPVDLTIINSFEPGGLELATKQLVEFVSQL